ncbi:MAG: ArnT family glycosyltransferase [Saprospiraceae bacterium]
MSELRATFLKYQLLPFQIIATIAVLTVSDNPFFWDTIQLGSKHAHWYYEQQFSQLLLPAEIDSGHPPLFGLYLAFCWTLFGKSLLVSHLAMLPFVWASVWAVFQLGKYYGTPQIAWLLLLIFFVDPTFAAQHVLVSPDVIVAAMFMLIWYAILHNLRLLQIIAMVILALISMRGMMIVAALFIFDCWCDMQGLQERKHRVQKKFNLQYCTLVMIRKVFIYVPAGLAALAFLVFHYQQTGWIGYHADSSWAPSFAKVDFSGFIKNIAVLGWRLLDFGRVFVWIAVFIGIGIGWKKGKLSFFKQPRIYQLLLLGVILFLTLTPSLLLHKFLSAHRYLLPIMIWLNVLAYYLIVHVIENKKWKKILSGLVIAGLLTGNLWIYPKTFSQGWDSTLAHLPHYELRAEVLQFLQQQNISLAQVGTAFPEIGALKYKDLTERTEGMLEKDLSQQQYVYFSNIMNDFSDTEIATLERKWQVIFCKKSGGVEAWIYQKERSSD